MVGVAVVLGASVATATPVGADPSQFGTLVVAARRQSGIPAGNPDVKSQVDQGIRQGLDSLHGNPSGPGF